MIKPLGPGNDLYTGNGQFSLRTYAAPWEAC